MGNLYSYQKNKIVYLNRKKKVFTFVSGIVFILGGNIIILKTVSGSTFCWSGVLKLNDHLVFISHLSTSLTIAQN